MKVGANNRVSGPQGPSGSARPAAGGFSIAGAEPTGETAAAAKAGGVTSVGSIDALLALQSVGTPTERRRRAVGRAGRILDVLDDLKLTLIEGGQSHETLGRLIKAVREERDAVDDRNLEGVLNEIETRAAVELAKLGAAA